MLNLRKVFTKNDAEKPRNYFEMSPSEKTKILKRAVKEANDEQMGLIDDYEKKFGEKVDLSKCKN